MFGLLGRSVSLGVGCVFLKPSPIPRVLSCLVHVVQEGRPQFPASATTSVAFGQALSSGTVSTAKA